MLIRRLPSHTKFLLVTPGEHIEIIIRETSTNHVTIGIEAPQRVKIHDPTPLSPNPNRRENVEDETDNR